MMSSQAEQIFDVSPHPSVPASASTRAPAGTFFHAYHTHSEPPPPPIIHTFSLPCQITSPGRLAPPSPAYPRSQQSRIPREPTQGNMATTLSLLHVLFLLLSLASTIPSTMADQQQETSDSSPDSSPSSSSITSSYTPAPIIPPGHLQMFVLVNNVDVPIQATIVYNYTDVSWS